MAKALRHARRAPRRIAFLVGASLLAYAAAPSTAWAQNECGPAPPGGGTVTCPPGDYPNGIDYDTVNDLTVVLEAGVVTQGTVSVTGTGAGTDVRIEGEVDTDINSDQPGILIGLDANLAEGSADLLRAGAATGSTALDVALIGAPIFRLDGIRVVDAGPGSSASAFTVGGGSGSPYVALDVVFDASANDFLLLAHPTRPVFETVMVGGVALDVWYQSADAVRAQLDSERDGVPRGESGRLTTERGLSGWAQVFAGDRERDAVQSFAAGGTASDFDVGYDQDHEGVQGGIDYRTGAALFGLAFGMGESDAIFSISSNRLDLDSINAGAYAAVRSGAFFGSLLGKADWIDAEANPGAGLAAEFEATAIGLRGIAGFRLDSGRFHAEPAVSLSWVQLDIEDYASGGATVTFRDLTSVRGSAGVRLGGDFALGGGTLSPFAGVHAIDEFRGDSRATFTLGDAVSLEQDAPNTWAELSGGATWTSGNVEAFVRGELDLGGDMDGMHGRAGVRIRF